MFDFEAALHPYSRNKVKDIIPEQCVRDAVPSYSSQSNSAVEEAIGRVEEQVRVLLLDKKARYGIEIDMTAAGAEVRPDKNGNKTTGKKQRGAGSGVGKHEGEV